MKKKTVSEHCFGQNVFPGGKQWNKSGSGAETHSPYVKVISSRVHQPVKVISPNKSSYNPCNQASIIISTFFNFLLILQSLQSVSCAKDFCNFVWLNLSPVQRTTSKESSSQSSLHSQSSQLSPSRRWVSLLCFSAC